MAHIRGIADRGSIPLFATKIKGSYEPFLFLAVLANEFDHLPSSLAISANQSHTPHRY